MGDIAIPLEQSCKTCRPAACGSGTVVCPPLLYTVSVGSIVWHLVALQMCRFASTIVVFCLRCCCYELRCETFLEPVSRQLSIGDAKTIQRESQEYLTFCPWHWHKRKQPHPGRVWFNFVCKCFWAEFVFETPARYQRMRWIAAVPLLVQSRVPEHRRELRVHVRGRIQGRRKNLRK